MKKSNKDLRTTTIFFILAFTFAFFTFSIGNSALSSQKNKLAKLQGDKNRKLQVQANEIITTDDIVDILNQNKVTIQLEREVVVQEDRSKNFLITTEIKNDGFSRWGDLRYGEYLSTEQYLGEESIGVFSSSISKDDNFELKYISENTEETVDIKAIGKTFDIERMIDVPNDIFFKIVGDNIVNSGSFSINLSGKEAELDKSIKAVKDYIIKIDPQAEVKGEGIIIGDTSKEAKQMFIASILIIAITIINSISIASLWIEDKRKELVIRKVCGAKDMTLAKLFLGRLFVVSIISVVLAIIMQWIISIIFKGVFLNMDIRIRFNNIAYSFVLSIGVAFLTSIPALKYISEIQPTEMLRGE